MYKINPATAHFVEQVYKSIPNRIHQNRKWCTSLFISETCQ